MQLLNPIINQLGKNYQPFANNAEFGDGNLWETQRGERSVTIEQYYDGSSFYAEAPSTLLAKTAGLILGGRYFFLAASGYHIGLAAKEGFATMRDLYTRFKVQKGENTDLTLKAFIQQQNKSVYSKVVKASLQAGKSLMCLTPFLFAPNPIGAIGMDPLGFLSMDFSFGNTAWYLFGAYCVYHPQYPRVLLSKIEDWMVVKTVESTTKLRSRDSSDSKSSTVEASSSTTTVSPALPRRKGFHHQLQDLFEWRVPISSYLGWTKIDNHTAVRELAGHGDSKKLD